MAPSTWKRAADAHLVPITPGAVPTREAARPLPLTVRAALASRLLPPEIAVARRTAAWIWRLDVLAPGTTAAGSHVELTGPGTSFDAELPSGHIVEESGVRVTSLDRTALDCARWLPRHEAVAALDQFLRRGVDHDDLKAMARALPGYRDARRLREVLRLGDRGAGSPGESWVRVRVVEAGFPRPATQVPVPGPRGGPLYIDLGYEQFRVGLEYDGERHHTGIRARTHDAHRRRWLATQMGWEVIPVTKDFLARPGPYLEALLTALLHRGWQPDDAVMQRIAAHLARLSRPRRAW
ncbi:MULTISPECIES: hypothetical protein [Actinomadura]|uniref:DUF559 domain-containing protein n=1 Tax=Actinomadura yumaensis TaxID=111807 RepID=A0ABW2CME6_9ACTN|nr:hypothetical protein [Actinomadura sp. J1-007]MWK38740.1 hypothetical protein [Actinomadura sp. J1-007]